jgi:hypothetical protein
MHQKEIDQRRQNILAMPIIPESSEPAYDQDDDADDDADELDPTALQQATAKPAAAVPQIVIGSDGDSPPNSRQQPTDNSRFSCIFDSDPSDARASTIFKKPPNIRGMNAGAGYAMMFSKQASDFGFDDDDNDGDEDGDLFGNNSGDSDDEKQQQQQQQQQQASKSKSTRGTLLLAAKANDQFRVSRSSLLMQATDWRSNAPVKMLSAAPSTANSFGAITRAPISERKATTREQSIATSNSDNDNDDNDKEEQQHGDDEGDDDDDEGDLYVDDDDEEDDDEDWNQRFQTIMEKIASFSPNTPINEEITTNLALIGLAQDFLYSATAYGKIIISEVYLADAKKTIKPANVGGVAGGSKYIAQDILFKFALDNDGLYGNNDSAAATVAGHELKGLQAYFNCAIAHLSLPLMALVDYRGFRLIAISFLPINERTLVYGTNDGGNTMHDKNAKMRQMMKRASEILNLAEHMAGVHADKRKLMYSAADLEGHRGTDNRFYLLDFSRTFPCEAPLSRKPGVNLTRLLRPEFVRSYKQPLCPDAYSSFTDVSYNAAIDAATRHLHWDVIPNFARLLPTLLVEQQSGVLDGSGCNTISFRLTEAVHSHGINVRYLGLVYMSLTTMPQVQYRDTCRALVFIEMLARVIKNDLRQRLRERMKKVKKPLEEPYRRLVIEFLNIVFGTTPESVEYWDNQLLHALHVKVCTRESARERERERARERRDCECVCVLIGSL